ncbi:MAG TPA: ABC transporter substrate-binding protein [Xanthobacteraceae bacterium]|nr:ABC transporter substrate-binding protein [Xanthobacteraceae bacterium]
MRSTKVILGGLVALALFAAGTAAAEPLKIRVAWVVGVANWSSLILEKKDLAQHLGKSYVFEPVHYTGTPLMITAMATGDLEIGDLAYSSLALAIENAGMDDLRVIGDDFQDGVGDHYSTEYFVLKDGPIKTVEDLKGQVLATNAAGSAVDIAMRAMLRKHGLEDKRDYTVVEAAFPTMGAMLTGKKAALIPGVIPFSLNPELRNAARVLFTQKEAIGPTQMIVWAARKSFLDKNRAAVVDMMEDVLRIVRWYLDPANHKEAVEIAARFTKQPPERFDSWLFMAKDYYRDPDLKPNLASLQNNIDTQKQLGFIKSDFDVKKYSDLSIVEEAARRLK